MNPNDLIEAINRDPSLVDGLPYGLDGDIDLNLVAERLRERSWGQPKAPVQILLDLES